MTKEHTEEQLVEWCNEVADSVRRASRTGDGLEGYLDQVPLSRERVRKDCWDFLITYGGPNVWLRITPKRATVIGAWGGAQHKKHIAIDAAKLSRAVAITNELD